MRQFQRLWFDLHRHSNKFNVRGISSIVGSQFTTDNTAPVMDAFRIKYGPPVSTLDQNDSTKIREINLCSLTFRSSQ